MPANLRWSNLLHFKKNAVNQQHGRSAAARAPSEHPTLFDFLQCCRKLPSAPQSGLVAPLPTTSPH